VENEEENDDDDDDDDNFLSWDLEMPE
jgi:hypothetical protein